MAAEMAEGFRFSTSMMDSKLCDVLFAFVIFGPFIQLFPSIWSVKIGLFNFCTFGLFKNSYVLLFFSL